MTDRDKLKAEHGELATVTLKGADYHFRTPTAPEYQRCADRMSKDKGAGIGALKELVFCCSVGDDCNETFAKLPAAVQQVGLALLELAGSEVEVTISKD